MAAAIRAAGAEARIEEFAAGTPTAREAAEAVGCELDRIVKSLVFECDGRPVVVLVPGDRRADPAKVAAAAGCDRARVASPGTVEEVTGFAPGAVAPFPLRRPALVLVDRRLLGHELVWIGAGSERHMAGLPPDELVRIAKAEAIDASAES